MSQGITKERLFSTVPVGKAVISLAIPTVISQLINVIYNMADTFFIGRMGDPNQVAAATLAMPTFIFLTAFANLFGVGGASMISRCLGAGKREKAKNTAAFCIWSAAIVSLCYGIVIVLLRNALLPILGADASTFGFCSKYIFWTVGVGAMPTVLSATLAHLVRSEGYSGKASFGVAFGGILNIVLDPIFIFVFDMQIAGAAIATMLSNVASTVYFLILIFRNRKISVISLSPKHYTLRQHIPAEVVAVGLPSFIMTLMSTLSNLMLNKTISGYSNEAIAGMGIAKKIDLMAFAIAQGMTQGTLPLIGYNFSSGNRRRMIDALKVLLIDCLAISVAAFLLMFFGAGVITKCFINDKTTVEYGRIFLRIVAIACPTTALNFLAVTIFQATGKKAQPLLLSMLRKGTLDIPLMLLFNATVGLRGVAWSTPLADMIAMLVSAALVIPYLKKLLAKDKITE